MTAKQTKEVVDSKHHHVINKDVNKIFNKIIDIFLLQTSPEDQNDVKNFQQFKERYGKRKEVDLSVLLKACNLPMCKDTQTFIEDSCVEFVHKDNKNAEIYGPAVGKLREAVFKRMTCINNAKSESHDKPYISPSSKDIDECLKTFIDEKVYVDEVALEHWLKGEGTPQQIENERKKKKKEYEKALQEVETMIRRLSPRDGKDEVADWVDVIRTARNLDLTK